MSTQRAIVLAGQLVFFAAVVGVAVPLGFALAVGDAALTALRRR